MLQKPRFPDVWRERARTRHKREMSSHVDVLLLTVRSGLSCSVARRRSQLEKTFPINTFWKSGSVYNPVCFHIVPPCVFDPDPLANVSKAPLNSGARSLTSGVSSG